MNRVPLLCGFMLAMVGGTTSAANVHGVTWVRKAVSPGTLVTIGGRQFVLVRLPMKEFSNSNRYVVEFLADVLDPGPPVAFAADLLTAHSDATIANPEIISGYPAAIDVQDGRTYSYAANYFLDNGLGVDATVYGNLQIKVGDTMVNLGTYFTATQQALTTVPPPDGSASPYATWSYTDPTALVGYFDNWIDYIRIVKLP